MSSEVFRAAYLSPDVACLIATFQNGHYRDALAMQSLVIPRHIARDTFPHDEYAALAATLDPWLSEYGLARLPRLIDSLDDMHMIMLLHAAYSGRVDVVQRALEIRSATPAMMLLMVDVAAWNNQRSVLGYLVNLPHHDGWTCSSVALIAASREGHLDIVRFLHEKFPLVPTTEDAMDMAAAGGYLDVVQYLHAHRQEGCTTRAMDGAAKNGHLDVLQFLHANRNEGCTEQAMDWACEHGHLEVAQWLHEHRRWEGLTETAFNGAAANNHLSVVEFLHHVVRAPSTIKATEWAAAAGHWAMVQWIHDHRPVQGWTDEPLKIAAGLGILDGNGQVADSRRCDAAARKGFAGAIESGDAEALEWLVTHRPYDGSIYNSMVLAATFGHVEVVRWLMQQGTETYSAVHVANIACNDGHLDLVKLLHEHDADSFTAGSFAGAARGGHLDVVEWLYDKGVAPHPNESYALDQAAWFGHLHVVKWLHARSFPATVAAMDKAVAGGHFHVVRWFHTHRQKGCTEHAMAHAAWRGDFSLVRWLHRHRKLHGTDSAMTGAAKNGDRAMFEFLYARRSEDLTSETMDIAAKWGHLDLLLYIHNLRLETCTGNAFCGAVAAGHFTIAKWLHATHGFPVTSQVLRAAATNGDLTCMQWLLTLWQGAVPAMDADYQMERLTMAQLLLEKGSVCSAEAMDKVIQRGHFARLIKLHEFGATCSPNAMSYAVQNNDIDVARWLIANQTDFCAVSALEDAIAIGSIRMVKFLMYDVGVTAPAASLLVHAAHRHKLNVVKWLNAHFPVDLAGLVEWATNKRHMPTARWILENASIPISGSSPKRRKVSR